MSPQYAHSDDEEWEQIDLDEPLELERPMTSRPGEDELTGPVSDEGSNGELPAFRKVPHVGDREDPDKLLGDLEEFEGLPSSGTSGVMPQPPTSSRASGSHDVVPRSHAEIADPRDDGDQPVESVGPYPIVRRYPVEYDASGARKFPTVYDIEWYPDVRMPSSRRPFTVHRAEWPFKIGKTKLVAEWKAIRDLEKEEVRLMSMCDPHQLPQLRSDYEVVTRRPSSDAPAAVVVDSQRSMPGGFRVGYRSRRAPSPIHEFDGL